MRKIVRLAAQYNVAHRSGSPRRRPAVVSPVSQYAALVKYIMLLAWN
ncbi:MAG: hypothetical protein ACPL3C_11470 [Pyrobaculum sp.]